MTRPDGAVGELDAGRAPGDVLTRALPAFFLTGLAVLLVAIVLGSVLHVSYKTVARGLPIIWLVTLLHPAGRRVLPYRPHRSDLPLLAFAAVATLSVLFGGGHWGDVRNLVAAIGIMLLCRALFAAPSRRPLVLHYLGGLVVLVLARELVAVPQLLRLAELDRYTLVTANPNVLGFLFAMLAPIFLGEALAARVTSDPRRAAAAALYYVLAVLGVLMTFSRSAAVGLAVGTFVVALATRRRAAAIALVAIAVVLFIVVQRPDRWASTRAPGDADRLRIMRTSLSLALESPVLGVGYGINNLEERFPARFEALYGERLFRFHSANQLVDLLVGTGVAGTALALWWAVTLGREVVGRAGRAAGAERLRAAGGLAALVAIGLMSLAEPPLYAGKLVPVLFVVIAYAQLGGGRD